MILYEIGILYVAYNQVKDFSTINNIKDNDEIGCCDCDNGGINKDYLKGISETKNCTSCRWDIIQV